MILKNSAIILFFIMFIYSGVGKIFNFNNKVNVLQTKTKLPHMINVFGMVLVILLEIMGSILVIYDQYNPGVIDVKKIKATYLSFLIFLIVVTLLYHPPGKHMIPFLSNLTTFGGLLYIYEDKFN
jgi:uncharacterized membrane protein YphA (DoxX/SURF4 family)